MMVKSAQQSSHGRFNPKKKKVWIKKEDDEDSESVEIEVEIYDFSDYAIYFYNEKGKLILEEKKKSLIDVRV